MNALITDSSTWFFGWGLLALAGLIWLTAVIALAFDNNNKPRK